MDGVAGEKWGESEAQRWVNVNQAFLPSLARGKPLNTSSPPTQPPCLARSPCAQQDKFKARQETLISRIIWRTCFLFTFLETYMLSKWEEDQGGKGRANVIFS